MNTQSYAYWYGYLLATLEGLIEENPALKESRSMRVLIALVEKEQAEESLVQLVNKIKQTV